MNTKIRTVIKTLLIVGALWGAGVPRAGAQSPAPGRPQDLSGARSAPYAAYYAAGHSLALSWGVAVPVGGSFMTRSACVAPQLEWEWALPGSFSVGASAGVAYGRESGFTTDRVEGDIVSGPSTRSLALVPVSLYARWYPWRGKGMRLQPYLGAGGGLLYGSYSLTGDLINTSGSGSWSGQGFGELGLRCALGGGRTALDLRCAYRAGGVRWETVDKAGERRLEVRLGLSVKL